MILGRVEQSDKPVFILAYGLILQV